MATATLNGIRVLRADVREPRIGNWTADVVLDADTAPSGAATLAIGAVAFVGSVRRAGAFSGRASVRIVGGTGGLTRTVAAKAYRGAPLAIVRDDVLHEAGDTSDPTGASLLDLVPSHWQRMRGTAGAALLGVAAHASLVLRVGRSGLVFIGADTFPAVAIDHQLIEERSDDGRVVIALGNGVDPLVRPAVTFRSRRVEHVVTRIESDAMRQEVWFA